MSQELTIKNYLKQPAIVDRIKEALPASKRAKADRYISGVLIAIAMDKTNKLVQADKQSILQSCLTAAQLGIDVDARGHAYLVPYWDKDKKMNEAQLQIGYKYYASKFTNHPEVELFSCEAVYKGDLFKVKKGTNPEIIHEPDVNSDDYQNDSALTHVYALVKLRTGQLNFEVMSKKKVDEIMQRVTGRMSEGALAYSPWSTSYGEMARKTVCKRLGKWLQLDDEDYNKVVEHEIMYDNSRVETAEDTEVSEIDLTAEPEVAKEEEPKKAPTKKPAKKKTSEPLF